MTEIRKVKAYAIFVPTAQKRKIVINILKNSNFTFNLSKVPEYIITYKNPESLLKGISGIKILRITDRYHNILLSTLNGLEEEPVKKPEFKPGDFVIIKKEGPFNGMQGKVKQIVSEKVVKVILSVWGIPHEETFKFEELEKPENFLS